jgi:hypothetical protein
LADRVDFHRCLGWALFFWKPWRTWFSSWG